MALTRPGKGRPTLADFPGLIGIAALVGWALLAATGSGIDPGDGLAGGRLTGAFLALALGAPMAAAVVLMAADRAVWRAHPTVLAVAGAGGLAIWSALSITWAAAPDLAWIDTNRTLIALSALAIGIGVGALLPGAPARLGIGISLAALPVIGLAVGGRIVPTWLGSDNELARLAEPVGYWNALALICAMAIPGLLWLARGGVWVTCVSGAALVIPVVALLLTYSRGGLMAAALMVTVVVAIVPRRGGPIAALTGACVGALAPAVHGLTDPTLTADHLPASLRHDAGLGLGWRLVLGTVLAAAVAGAVAAAWQRVPRRRLRARRAIAIGAAVVVLVPAAASLASPSGQEWWGERWGEVRGEGGGGVDNDAGRILSTSDNQRAAWWGQAWRASMDAPAIGHGAGGFRLVHLQERRVENDRLVTNESHDVVLRTLSGTGLVGVALLLILCAGVGWAVVRARVRGGDPALALPLAIMAGFVLQASLDWSWAIPALTIPAFAAAGVVLAAAAPGRSRQRRTPSWLAPVVVATAAVAMISALLPWWSTQLVDSAERALVAGDARGARADARAARSRNPLSLEPLRVEAAAHLDLGDPARALGALQRMTRVQPDNPASWRALARFYGQDPRAADAWRRVAELDPRDGQAVAYIGG